MTHLCISKLTSIASDNGLSPGRRQAVIWNNAGILLIRPLRTNFSEILIEIQTFSLKKILLKMSSAKCTPFCLGLNVLNCLSYPNRSWVWSPTGLQMAWYCQTTSSNKPHSLTCVLKMFKVTVNFEWCLCDQILFESYQGLNSHFMG